MKERLQKVMAQAGVASRRACEGLIRAGRVAVNGQIVTQLGTQVDLARDQISVDGKPLQVKPAHLYFKINKPLGLISTASDPWGRKTVVEMIGTTERIYPVGRLDADSEGLMLLTNDGAATERLTHARYGHAKTYLVLVRGSPSNEALAALVRGVELDDGPAQALDVVRIVGVPRSAPGMNLTAPAGATWLEITLGEGRKRQVRRMLEQIGHRVERLIRTRLGPLALSDMRPGEVRPLTPAEVRALTQPARRLPVRDRAHARSDASTTHHPTPRRTRKTR